MRNSETLCSTYQFLHTTAWTYHHIHLQNLRIYVLFYPPLMSKYKGALYQNVCAVCIQNYYPSYHSI